MKQQLFIYAIDGIDYDKVIANYRSLCLKGKREIDDTKTTLSVFHPTDIYYVVVKEPREPLRDDIKALNKIKFLVHSIAYRKLTLEDTENGIPMQAAIMQKVIGKDYYELILSLIECGYITRNPIYERGKSSMKYKIIGLITTEPCSNATILKYIEKSKILVHEQIQKYLTTPNIKIEYGDNFFPTYIRNLNKFSIKDIKRFNTYTEEKITENPESKSYYNFIRQSFKEILQSLFRKRISCIHIHDAIVVPDVKGTQKVEPQPIIDVMKEVYEKYGLYPTFKVE